MPAQRNIHLGKELLQWGRNLAIAEICYDLPLVPLGVTLQWGRDQTANDRGDQVPDVPAKVYRMLQWGRDRSIAEMSQASECALHR